MRCKHHDDETDNYEDKLAALVQEYPYLTQFVDEIRSTEPYFEEFGLPVTFHYSLVVVNVSLDHVTVVMQLRVWLLDHLDIVGVLFHAYPLDNLTADVVADREVHQVDYELLPNVGLVDLEAD